VLRSAASITRSQQRLTNYSFHVTGCSSVAQIENPISNAHHASLPPYPHRSGSTHSQILDQLATVPVPPALPWPKRNQRVYRKSRLGTGAKTTYCRTGPDECRICGCRYCREWERWKGRCCKDEIEHLEERIIRKDRVQNEMTQMQSIFILLSISGCFGHSIQGSANTL
jgi:hypothetical protein